MVAQPSARLEQQIAMLFIAINGLFYWVMVINMKIQALDRSRKRMASRRRANTFQKVASCVVVKFIRIRVLGLRTA